MTSPVPQSHLPPTSVPDPIGRDRLERTWLERTRQGDEQAFEALFHAYVEPLCAFAYTYIGSQHAAQEIVQELFCRMWERRHSLDAPRSVRAYLYGAVRNRAINYLRNRRIERAFQARALRAEHVREGSHRASPAEEEVDAAALAEAVEQAVREMPARCREVFTLTRDQQLSYAEVASVLRISRKTVEIHIGRALAFLRQRLGPWLAG